MLTNNTYNVGTTPILSIDGIVMRACPYMGGICEKECYPKISKYQFHK